jgi:hypothetical protein
MENICMDNGKKDMLVELTYLEVGILLCLVIFKEEKLLDHLS